jgi:MFS superfamily sulfate permease-like transporter
MAKYPHRIFEMFEFRDEAIRALAPKSYQPVMDATPETWTFEHLSVSLSDRVMHVAFKNARIFGEQTATSFRHDLTQLTDRLVRNTRVLLDFSGVESVDTDSMEALVLFNQKLRTKGSRMALCCLEPSARECFFVARSHQNDGPSSGR